MANNTKASWTETPEQATIQSLTARGTILFHLSPLGKQSFTARIEGAHSDRAASAGTKDRLAVSRLPFRERVFREQENDRLPFSSHQIQGAVDRASHVLIYLTEPV